MALFPLCAAALLAACSNPSGDWWYHFRCNGDPACISTNPTTETSGDLDEGPEKLSCTQLLEFSRRFWNEPPAVDWCDQSPTGAGGPGGSPDGGGNPDGGGHPDGGGGGVVTGPPILSYVTPGGAPGAIISITGSNFPADGFGITVTICGANATIAQASASNLNVVIPLVAAGNCTLVVTNAKGSTTDGSPFPVGNAHAPQRLVVDGGYVYWTESEANGSVKRVSTSGGPVATLATLLEQPNFLAVDSNNVYWSEQRAIRSSPKAGGGVNTLVSGLTQAYAIAVDPAGVYFTENNVATLKRVALGGGTPVTLLTDLSTPNAFAVGPGGIYYFGAGQHLSRAPLTGGAGTAISALSDLPVSIAIDAAQAYWGYTGLHKSALAGGAESTYPNSVYEIEALVVDASTIYFSSSGNLYSVPIAGGSTTVLASAAGVFLGLAADTSNLYWTDSSIPGIKRMAKTGGAVTVIATSPNLP